MATEKKYPPTIRVRGHKLTSARMGPLQCSYTVGECTCGWSDHAQNREWLRYKYYDHLRDIAVTMKIENPRLFPQLPED
jgi:hypothetical protein